MGMWKLGGARFLCMGFFFVLIGIPYKTWQYSGFQAIDARNVEIMVEQQLAAEDNIASADARFIVMSRSVMKGQVFAELTDGTSTIVNCSAELGKDGDYLLDCEDS